MDELNKGINYLSDSKNKIKNFQSVTKKVTINKFLNSDIFGFEDALIPNSCHSYSVQCDSEL